MLSPMGLPSPAASTPSRIRLESTGSLLLALALLAWRLAAQSPGFLWRDWVVVLAVYLLASAFTLPRERKARIELCLMFYLLGIYCAAQAKWMLYAWIGQP